MNRAVVARYLTPDQMEAEYGFNKQTLANDRWQRKGFPYHKRGKNIYYKRSDVEAEMEKLRVVPRKVVSE